MPSTPSRGATIRAVCTVVLLIRRPLSPHLQVYRWPVSMALSILHRITGVGLGLGTLLLAWWLIAAAVSDDAFAGVQWFLATPIGMLVLFGWTLALCFHFFSGIRHLVWDAGYGFEQPWYDRSGWAVVIATVAAALLLWIIGLAVW